MTHSEHSSDLRNNDVYEVATGVRTTGNEDGGIVLDIDQGQMFRLNPVGAQILELLSKGLEDADIAHEITRQYGIEEIVVLADVREFLSSLERLRLIHLRWK